MPVTRRKTDRQKEVLNLLSRSAKALSADDVLELLSLKINKVSVYRMLSRFEEDGAIHSIMGSDGRMYYALHTDDHDGLNAHVHFQCKICRSLECVDTAVTIPEINGYAAESAQLLLVGICGRCTE